jgi:hypothetical protein
MTTPATIEKLMSLTQQEFIDTLARLGTSEKLADGSQSFQMSNGTVRVSYTAQPGVTLGGLLALPRAKVLLAFDSVDEKTRAEFLKRFEFTFQRGGG